MLKARGRGLCDRAPDARQEQLADPSQRHGYIRRQAFFPQFHAILIDVGSIWDSWKAAEWRGTPLRSAHPYECLLESISSVVCGNEFMRIPYFQVNAFTTETFGGNPAGVCLLESWLPDALLQRIAAENDFSETAFLVPVAGGFRLRWFTPVAEVDLCGHATLASAHVLFFEREWPRQSIEFETLSGRLGAKRVGDHLELDFPSTPPLPCVAPEALLKALRRAPEEVLKSRDYLVRFRSEEDVIRTQPDLGLISGLDGRGLILTAPGNAVDFVSRFFAPKLGVPEDPVTGSAHSALIPYWAGRLGRQQLRARQLSARGGDLICELRGERVAIGGQAVVYCRGQLVLP